MWALSLQWRFRASQYRWSSAYVVSSVFVVRWGERWAGSLRAPDLSAAGYLANNVSLQRKLPKPVVRTLSLWQAMGILERLWNSLHCTATCLCLSFSGIRDDALCMLAAVICLSHPGLLSERSRIDIFCLRLVLSFIFAVLLLFASINFYFYPFLSVTLVISLRIERKSFFINAF